MNNQLIDLVDTRSIINLRKQCNENQTHFWQKFGVTQSRGSRFEAGADIPSAVRLLIKLYVNGVVKDQDLAKMNDG